MSQTSTTLKVDVKINVGDFIYALNNNDKTASLIGICSTNFNPNILIPRTIHYDGQIYLITFICYQN